MKEDEAMTTAKVSMRQGMDITDGWEANGLPGTDEQKADAIAIAEAMVELVRQGYYLRCEDSDPDTHSVMREPLDGELVLSPWSSLQPVPFESLGVLTVALRLETNFRRITR